MTGASSTTTTRESDGRERALSAVVVGGGLAGIAAAVQLADAGVAVTLVETRRRLGGRATSFVDPKTGELLDNCQHVLMKCCTHLLSLYERLGVADEIDWHARFYLVDANGTIDILEGEDLPAPTHMTRSLWAFRSLTIRDKLAISTAMFAMMRMGESGRSAWHDRSFAAFLREHRQPASVIEKYWAPIVISALNEQPEDMAADYAIQVFQEGFLSTADGYVMGLSRVPLVKLYDAAEQAIAKAGGRVMLSTSADGFEGDDQRIRALRLSNGESLVADMFVSAVPFDRLAKLVTPAMVSRDDRLAGLGEIDVSPIIGIHLWFDRPVMDLPHMALTQSPLQWVFNKGVDESSGTGHHLHGVISAAHEWVDQPAQAIIDMAVREMQHVLPDMTVAPAARLLHARAVKEKRATFSLRPGIDRLRPGSRGAIANLYTAGDWTRSGWPATMEGAVRSGNFAAVAILDDAGRPAPVLPTDMPPEPLYRAIGMLPT